MSVHVEFNPGTCSRNILFQQIYDLLPLSSVDLVIMSVCGTIVRGTDDHWENNLFTILRVLTQSQTFLSDLKLWIAIAMAIEH